MSKILKNNTGSAVPISDVGQEVPASGQLTIQATDYGIFAASSDTVGLLSDGTLTMNNGSEDLALADAVQFLQGGFNKVSVNEQPTFASKKIGALSLFNRTHGAEFELSAGANSLLFPVPYNVQKFNGIEIIGAELGDFADLKILDTDGVATPNYFPYGNNFVLNQFGFDVYIRPDFYERQSRYDADLLKNMQIEIIYVSETAKSVFINYMLHELK